jgi:Uma2 family endonuclease
MSALLAPMPTAPSQHTGWPRRVPEFAGERWTVDEVNAMPHPERFEGRRLFLLHGEIWEQGRMNPPHAIALDLTNEALRNLFPSGYRVRPQLGFSVDEETIVLPDLLVVKGAARDFMDRHPTTADLIVEVSDTTLFFDTTTKAELYATAGVPEYWVLDVNARTLLVLRDPAPVNGNGHAYRSSRTLTEADSVTPLAAPTATLRITDLLP